jgi:predicted acyltransferase
VQTVSKAAAAKPVTPGSGRLMALDVFRGATIASMMLVNNPGSWDHVYGQLDHAEWDGWTFTDLIFPFFLWIVGVAIPLSTAKRIERGESRGALFLHVLRRAVIIFGLGLGLAFFSFTINGSLAKAGGLANWWHEVWTTIRIPGVLQRIAVCYLIASGIFLGTKLRGQIAWVVGLLAGYWLLMKLAPVPGFGAGLLTKEENFSAYVDGLILGKHTWQGMAWDPEGVVSTIPAVATCLFGVLTGQLLLIKRSVEQKTGWLFVAGNLLMFAGAIMNIWLPINKNLWTSSYAVFMAGLAMNIFAVFYWLVDVKGYQRWAKPFAIYGMNAITVFVLAGVLGRISIEKKVTNAAGELVSLKSYLYEGYFAHLSSDPKIPSLGWASVYVVGLYLVAYVMYRRKWFVRF